MTAYVDLVTLTVHLDATAEELRRLQALVRCPEQHDERMSQLATALLHEQVHLLSYLGSGLVKIHRKILESKLGAARSVAWEIGQSRLWDSVSVPLVDRRSQLFPNAVGAYSKLKVDVAIRTRLAMEHLNQYFMGYAPACDCMHLLSAYRQLLGPSNIAQSHQLGQLRTPASSTVKSMRTEDGICFMREFQYELAIPQICNGPADATTALPILPKIRALNVPGSDYPMLVCSRSVLEGLAVIGEIIGARARYRAPPMTRLALPVSYRAALVYCLDCINQASGERYTLSDFLTGDLPDWVYVTSAAMLDLTLQVEAPEHPITRHAVLIEKCPAWRLLLIGSCIKGRHASLIAPHTPFHCKKIHEWLRHVCLRLGWRPPGRQPTTAVSDCHNRPSGPLTGDSLLEQLRGAVAAQREQHALVYLAGEMGSSESNWLGFTAWVTRDRQHIFTTNDHIEARRDFIAIQEFTHYGLGALVFGAHWDPWWQRRGVRQPAEHSADIAEGLNHAIGLRAERSASEERERIYSAHDVLIRQEFGEILGCG